MNKTYTIKPRSKEYRIFVDNIVHKDGSQSRLVFCNSKLISSSYDMVDLPKTITNALYAELSNA